MNIWERNKIDSHPGIIMQYAIYANQKYYIYIPCDVSEEYIKDIVIYNIPLCSELNSPERIIPCGYN